jgi:hypothetical protein
MASPRFHIMARSGPEDLLEVSTPAAQERGARRCQLMAAPRAARLPHSAMLKLHQGVIMLQQRRGCLRPRGARAAWQAPPKCAPLDVLSRSPPAPRPFRPQAVALQTNSSPAVTAGNDWAIRTGAPAKGAKELHYKDFAEATKLAAMVESEGAEGRILRDLAASRYVCSQPRFAFEVRAGGALLPAAAAAPVPTGLRRHALAVPQRPRCRPPHPHPVLPGPPIPGPPAAVQALHARAPGEAVHARIRGAAEVRG